TIELISLGAAVLAAYWMRAGHVRSAAKFLALYAWLVVSPLVYLGDGLSSIAPSLYAPVIVLTLLFVGWRASLISAGATLLFTLTFLIARELGHHPPIIFPLNGLTPWTIFAMGLICMLIPIASVYHNVMAALQSAREQLTLREQAESALRQSEERFRLITSITSDYTFTSVIQPDGLPKNVAISGAFEAITGYTFEEYAAMGGYRASIHPDDVAEDDRVLDILKTNQPVVSELRIYTKSGEIRWTRANATPVWDNTQNRLVGIIGAVRDITAEKSAEQALHENEEKFRTIFDLAPYGITVQQSGGQFLDVNQAFLDITGTTREEVVGHNAAELDLFDLEHIKSLMREVATNGRIVNRELVVHPRNAPPRSLLISSQRVFLAGRVIVLTVGVDITERKQAEQALRESEERFRLISSATSDYTFAAIVN
ncbi:MAG: PAS domain S-box protein, partial [Anaerolineae bacterium]